MEFFLIIVIYLFVNTQIASEETKALRVIYYICAVTQHSRSSPNDKHFSARAKSWNRLPKAFYSSRPGCRGGGVRLIHFLFTNFNISSVFGIKDTLLSCNPSGHHSQTPRPGAVEGLGLPRLTIANSNSNFSCFSFFVKSRRILCN